MTPDRVLESDLGPLADDQEVIDEPIDERTRALLFTDARTVNNFSDRPVTDDQLRDIYELMKWGPTWANTLPLRIVYLTTEEAKTDLEAFLQPGNIEKARSAPVNAILAVDNAYHRHISRLLPFRPGMQQILDNDHALRQQIQLAGGWMQAAYFVVATRAVGLAAGPMGGFHGPELDRHFFPDGQSTTLLVVNLGYPGSDPWFDRLPRLNYDEAVRRL